MPLPLLRGIRPGMLGVIGAFLPLATAILVVEPARGQNVVQYSGSLRIGFGDSDIFAMPGANLILNFAIPACAIDSTNIFARRTFGSLPVFGRATQMGAGPGATLMFAGHGFPFDPQQVPSLQGGAERRTAATCRASRQPFLDPRYRSWIRTDSEIFPGTRGPWIGTTAAPAPTVAPQWTVGPGRGLAFPGANLVTPIPALDGHGAVAIQKGPNNFGGAIQYQGGGGFRVGFNPFIGTGCTPMAFGECAYFQGVFPRDPMPIGTDATGVDAPTPATRFPNGLLAGRVGMVAFRTPGPMGTVDRHGNIIEHPTRMVPVTSPVHYVGAFFEWTTGAVGYTDTIGSFKTNRSAMGFDSAVVDGPSGTTRRLQLVSPFAAAIKLTGPFGLPISGSAYGGVAVLDLKIAPAPEASLGSTFAVGALGMLGIVSWRFRKRC